MKALRIADWKGNYETSESSRIKKLLWVATPNGHDSVNFRRLLKHPNGMAHYGAWNLILQTASKCSERGLLTFGGTQHREPHTAETIADTTGGSEKIIAEAMVRLLEIGWLEEVDLNSLPSAGLALPSAGQATSTGRTGNTGQDRTGREETAPPGHSLLFKALRTAKAACEPSAIEEWITMLAEECRCEDDEMRAEAVPILVAAAKKAKAGFRFSREVRPFLAAWRCYQVEKAWKPGKAVNE